MYMIVKRFKINMRLHEDGSTHTKPLLGRRKSTPVYLKEVLKKIKKIYSQIYQFVPKKPYEFC